MDIAIAHPAAISNRWVRLIYRLAPFTDAWRSGTPDFHFTVVLDTVSLPHASGAFAGPEKEFFSA